MAATFCPLSLTPLMDEDGIPIVGARVRFYDAGTTTPRTVYRDGDLGNAYDPDGITTGANGRIPSVWLDGEPYRVRISTAGGTLIEDIDNLPINTDAEGGGGGGGDDTAVETGDVIFAFRTTARSGWVIPNGLSIGSATSGATGRANEDTHDLFILLWNTSTLLAVSGGRGDNAQSDWEANKRLTLPNICGRTVVGKDSAGIPSTGLLTGVVFDAGNPAGAGAYGGSGTIVLTQGQLPAVPLTGTTNPSGAHTHTGTTDAAGAHTPAGTVTVSYPPHAYTKLTGVTASGGATGGGAGFFTGFDLEGETEPPDDEDFTLTGTAVAAHTHTFTTAISVAHNHAFTTENMGLGNAHQNMPPFILLTPFMRL